MSGHRRLRLLPIIAAGIALGCASGRFEHRALVAPEAPHAELVLMRKSELAGGAFALKIELNGEKLVKLRTGRYATFRLAPGTYQLFFPGFNQVPQAYLEGLQLPEGSRTYVILGQVDLSWGVGVDVSTAGSGAVGVSAVPIMGFHVLREEIALGLMQSYKPVGGD